MSVFTNKPFSRFWNGRARSDSQPYPGDFVGDAAPPFAELASGSDPIPTAEELERIRYYHSKMAIKDADFVVSVRPPYLDVAFGILRDGITIDLRTACRIWI